MKIAADFLRAASCKMGYFSAPLALAFFAVQATGCASVLGPEHTALADSAANTIERSGRFFMTCPIRAGGCREWEHSFLLIAGPSIAALSYGASARQGLSNAGLIRACAGLQETLRAPKDLGDDGANAIFSDVRQDALLLYRMLDEEAKRRGLRDVGCDIPPEDLPPAPEVD